MTNTHHRWLPRTLFRSPYFMALCLSERAFHNELKDLKIPRKTWPDYLKKNAGACVHTFENDTTQIAIVVIDLSKRRTQPEIYGMLVHEATHIWRYIREELGENQPSTEFEAYAMQNIAQSLFESYERQQKKRKKRK